MLQTVGFLIEVKALKIGGALALRLLLLMRVTVLKY